VHAVISAAGAREGTFSPFHFDRTVRGIHPDASGGDFHGWPSGDPRLELEAR